MTELYKHACAGTWGTAGPWSVALVFLVPRMAPAVPELSAGHSAEQPGSLRAVSCRMASAVMVRNNDNFKDGINRVRNVQEATRFCGPPSFCDYGITIFLQRNTLALLVTLPALAS